MNQYEQMAARIEDVFSAHKVPARVWQATVTPSFVRYDITTALGTRLSAATNLSDELAFALGASSVRIRREGGVLRVEVPRGTPRRVDLAKLLPRIKPMPPLCGVLGLDEESNPLLVRLDSPDVAHILLAGTTGSGKTVLLRTLLLSLAMTNRPGQLQLVLLDPKGRGLDVLAALPNRWHALDVVTDTGDAATVLAAIAAEMERRDRERTNTPHLVVAIDELADLIQTGGSAITDAVTRLVQRGREAGIHVIAATQRPAAALVGGLLKANFPVRLVGRVTSSDDSKVATGIPGAEAERLLGRGDFLLVARGQVIRFQAAYADDAELRRLASLALAEPEPRRTRHWSGSHLAAVPQLAASSGAVLRRTAQEIAAWVGLGGVGIAPPPGLFASAGALATQPNPTQPNPAPRKTLRDRYTQAELVAYIEAAGGNLSEAAKAAFGYKDLTTMAIIRAAAAALQEAQ